jgi:glycosyltransferase involved in cell wall biosynthesis
MAGRQNEIGQRPAIVNSKAGDISVVIPFYNREEYIDQAVQSVLAQTLQPLEIIIVNDCSRESSRRYLDRYVDVCRIVDLPKNVGLAAARNAGIRQARGQFIALLDDDDIWLPRKLEVQHRYMIEHPECSSVHTAVWLFFSNRPDVRYKLFEPIPLSLAQALTHEQWVVPSTLLIRTRVVRDVGGFDPWFRENEDRDFVIRCCAAGCRIEGIDEPLARMRRESHNHLAGRPVRMYLAHVKLCWKHKALYYRVYGLRGILSFLLSSFYLVGDLYLIRKYKVVSMKTRCVDRGMRLVRRFLKVRYPVRPDYQEPVSSGIPMQREAPTCQMR